MEDEPKGEFPFETALIFSFKTLLPLEKTDEDDLKIEYAYIGKIVWIEMALCGYLAASFINYLTEQVYSYFKLP
jgi:hypothetical protein